MVGVAILIGLVLSGRWDVGLWTKEERRVRKKNRCWVKAGTFTVRMLSPNTSRSICLCYYIIHIEIFLGMT